MKLSCKTFHLFRTLKGAAAGAFGRLAARPARLLLGTARAQQKALMLASLLGISSIGHAATPPGTAISNTATASYSVGATGLTSSGTVSVTTASCTMVSVKVELMQYIPPSGAAQAPAAAAVTTVNPATYSTSGLTAGPFLPLANPMLPGNAAPTALPASLLLSPLADPQTGRVFSYAPNEPVFVRVTSYDSNTNPAAADTVLVTVTTSGDSETVQLTETGPSTGVFVGAIPTLFNVAAAPAANDGKITAASHNASISATYHHSNCTTGADVASAASGLIDPYGVVFDSASGAPVNGASISIVNALDGKLATVYCGDGVTVQPQPVTSGAPTACDATMVVGGYHFPLVAAGSYKLVVTPPSGHSFPSVVAAASMPATVGVPPAAPVILGNPSPAPGPSYGGVFSLWGPALKLDVPLDRGASTVTIQKSAGKSVVGAGEFVPYTLTVTNNGGGGRNVVQVADHVPPGFRYQKGSARLDGTVLADPAVSADARTLTFSFDIGASGSATVRYVLEVTPGARPGMADNTAAATGGLTSNTARASVMVREDLFRNKSTLIGRVTDGACGDEPDSKAKGMANVRIVLQDGTYILSDKDGNWHIDNLRPGTHVVQLDLDSLPKDYEVAPCGDNNRFAGRMYSQFVNVRPGTLWRADFHVQKKAPESLRLTQVLSVKQNGKSAAGILLSVNSAADVNSYSATMLLPDGAKYVAGTAKLNGAAIADPDIAGSALIFRSLARKAGWQDQYSVEVDGVKPNAEFRSMVRFTPPGRPAQNVPATQITLAGKSVNMSETFALIPLEAVAAKSDKPAKADDPTRLLEVLPYDDAWLATAQPGIEWLHPQESFHPNLPVMMVAVKHLPAQKATLRVNGEAVDPLRYDGAAMNAKRTVALSTWRGVEVKEGDNKVELVISDVSGKEISRSVRKIHYAASPDRVEFVPQQSRLVADGKTRPVVAVRLLDKSGVPVRKGISGEFTLNEPYRAWDGIEGLERDPLAGRIGGKARYEVKNDGIAFIELQPTTQSGEAILNFQFMDQRKQEVRAWLEAGQRDWILVGFAEGAKGHKTLAGNMQALQAADADKQLFDGNKVAFYAKGSIKGEYLLTLAYDTAKQTNNKQLKQAVDPTQYYTLYADASQARFDAASASRLYVKLERRQFYAMFGDYDTGLTVTELSRYSRTLNGVKSEYKGDAAGYNAFASVTEQAYIKDEIPGNGASGIYRLSRTNLVINSDKVRIETRDRFQSQVIVTTQTLTRYLDYDIDYARGALTFREPINVRDRNLNPTWIVAEYESADPSDKKATFGGRASVKPIKQLEIGATGVHEGTVGATGNLQGVDATYKPDDKTKVRAEVATTNRDVAGNGSNGTAWLAEVQRNDEKIAVKAYAREQSAGFGMGQQAASETGTRKVGVDGRVKLSDNVQVQGQAFVQETLGTGAQQTTVEGRVNERFGENTNAYYGARMAQDKTAAGATQSNQLIGGAAYTMPNKKVSLRGAAEISEGPAGSTVAPDRLVVGADYKVTEQTKLFAEQEFARAENYASNSTRAGVRTQPWSGGEVAASMGNSSTNDAERTYANLGMVQRWQISEQWLADFSVDRSQTLRNTATAVNVNTPQPFASSTGDYTAVAMGAGYRDTVWSGNARVEIRDADSGQQRNLQVGVQRTLSQGRSMAAGVTLRNAYGAGAVSNSSDLRVSYAHRPNDSKWTWFNRADYITQFSQAAGLTTKGEKLVNNLNANYMVNRHTQIALQYGAKYVMDSIDGTDYKGYTDLIGAEVRHDLNRDWDIGVFGSLMRSLNSGVSDFGYGASIGYNLMENMWLSVGYNVRGLSDRDFAGATYRARGPFVTLRMKIDQDTLKLNDKSGGLFAAGKKE